MSCWAHNLGVVLVVCNVQHVFTVCRDSLCIDNGNYLPDRNTCFLLRIKQWPESHRRRRPASVHLSSHSWVSLISTVNYSHSLARYCPKCLRHRVSLPRPCHFRLHTLFMLHSRLHPFRSSEQPDSACFLFRQLSSFTRCTLFHGLDSFSESFEIYDAASTSLSGPEN